MFLLQRFCGLQAVNIGGQTNLKGFGGLSIWLSPVPKTRAKKLVNNSHKFEFQIQEFRTFHISKLAKNCAISFVVTAHEHAIASEESTRLTPLIRSIKSRSKCGLELV